MWRTILPRSADADPDVRLSSPPPSASSPCPIFRNIAGTPTTCAVDCTTTKAAGSSVVEMEMSIREGRVEKEKTRTETDYE